MNDHTEGNIALRDRDAFFMVARREFTTKVKDKATIVSFVIVILGILASTLLPKLLNDPDEWKLAVVGTDAIALAQVLPESIGGSASLKTIRAASAAEATALVRSGTVQFALVPKAASPGEIPFRGIVKTPGSSRLVPLIQVQSAGLQTANRLKAAGLSEQQIVSAFTPAELSVQALEKPQRNRDDLAVVSTFVGILLFLQIFSFGMMVATSVVEEKSSRVVEIILSRMKPSVLLGGKVFGIGAVGLAQLVIYAAVGLTCAKLTGTLDITQIPAIAFISALPIFLLGYSMYSSAFAVGGALAGRLEDLQSTSGPMTLITMASYFVSTGVQNSTSMMSSVLAVVPPVAPFAILGRVASGNARVWELPVACIGCALTAFVLVRAAGRVYERSILRRGQQKLRAVLRSP